MPSPILQVEGRSTELHRVFKFCGYSSTVPFLDQFLDFAHCSGTMYLLRSAARKQLAHWGASSARRVVDLRRNFSKATFARWASFPDHEVLGLPALSPTMTEGTVQSWTVEIGDSFSAGDIICQIETDKAAVDFEATDDGFMAKHLVEPGHAPIATGSPIAVTVMEEEDIEAFANAQSSDFVSSAAGVEDAPAPKSAPAAPAPSLATPPSAAPVPKTTGGDRVFASPLARKIARENGIDILQMIGRGSGPRGRLIKADVEEFLASGGAVGGDVTMTAQQMEIAAHLTQAKREIPHYYLTVELNLDEMLKTRERANDGNGVEVSINDFILKAAAKAMKKVPEVNSSWMGSFIRSYDYVDINVGVRTDHGTVMPVIRDVDTQGLLSISQSTTTVAKGAREGTLAGSDYDSGTFTIINVGAYGVRQMEAIVQPPQSCILALGAAAPQVVPNTVESGDAFKVSTIVTATLSCDHRVVDGAVGAAWLAEFKTLVENPAKLLL